MTTKPNISDIQDEEENDDDDEINYEKPRIILEKIQFDNPGKYLHIKNV